jgi:hypothetical protein
MKHNEIRHKLSDYIDGSITTDEKTAIEDHLKSCPQCGSALEELRKTVGHIKDLEEVAPPAWMTQKIMARVRTEEERKKSWVERIFLPLRLKLPLEALGVVFLAVTVYFIYEHGPGKTAAPVWDGPVQELASKPEKRQPAPQKDKADRPAESQAGPKKEVPQEPGYKALDMKQAYEAPPPPKPAPAPQAAAPAEESARQEREDAREKTAIAPQAAAPQSMRDQALEAERKALSEAPLMAKKKGQALLGAGSTGYADNLNRAATKEKLVLTLTVADKALASEKIKEVIARSQGTILKRETIGNADNVIVRIGSDKFSDLVNRLKTLGRIVPKDFPKTPESGSIDVELRIVKGEQEKH